MHRDVRGRAPFVDTRTTRRSVTDPGPVGRTRRSVLRGMGAAGLLATGGPLLAGCGTEGAVTNEEDQAAAVDQSTRDKLVRFANWPYYIDVAEGSGQSAHPSLDAFTTRTGIRVDYLEEINDNDQFFGKIRPDLAAGRDIDRDLVVLTDWMVARLIRLNWVQRLDLANIPNARNLQPTLRRIGGDHGRRYSLPWQGVMCGIACNEKITGPVRNLTALLTRKDLRGRVTALTEMRDTMGLLLLEAGDNPAQVTDARFDQALGVLDDAVRSGQIRRFTGNDYVQDLQSGNVAACLAWSGDVVQLQADNPSIRFVVPEAGGMMSNDDMVVPNKAAHKRNAEALMNHFYDPAVAARLAAQVNFVCPVVGAQEVLAGTDPELAANELIFPTASTRSRLAGFRALDEETERRYGDRFQQVTGA